MVPCSGTNISFGGSLDSNKVGETGKVIDIDLTDEMSEKARRNAKKVVTPT
jgi:tRNA A58 N-methylase Trm61